MRMIAPPHPTDCRFPLSALRAYVLEDGETVKGFLLPGAATVIWSLIEIQQHLGIRGDVAEIGLFHGKLFILLALALRGDEIAIGVDPFEYSNFGQFEPEFRRNIARFGIDDAMIRIFRQTSQSLDPATLMRDRPRGVRLFSVDGNHTAAALAHDLPLAARCLADDGLLLIDDIFHTWSPEVTEAAIDFIRGNDQDLVPLALIDRQGSLRGGGCKLVACRSRHLVRYASFLRRLHPENLKTVAPFCGHRTPIFDFSDGVSKRHLLNYGGSDVP
jgi:hypothetical protein